MLALSTFAVVALGAVSTAASPATTIPHIYDPTNPYHRLPPSGSDPNFDCAWREAAFEYAQKIQPSNPKLPEVCVRCTLHAARCMLLLPPPPPPLLRMRLV